MKLAILMTALALGACATPPITSSPMPANPTVGFRSDPIRLTPLPSGVRATGDQSAVPTIQEQEEAARQEAGQQAAQKRAQENAEALREADHLVSKVALDAMIPQAKACLESSSDRIALQSQESATVAALGVWADCQWQLSQVESAAAVELGNAGAAEMMRGVQHNLMPDIIGRIVSARAAAARTTSQPPATPIPAKPAQPPGQDI